MRMENGDFRMRKPQRILFLLVLLGALGWVLWWFSREQETSFMEVRDTVFATTPPETHRAPVTVVSSLAKTTETRDLVPSTDHEERQIHVRIEDVAGVPLTGQSVLLIDEEGQRKQAVTDVDGEAAFPHPGWGHLVSRVLGQTPIIRDVTPDKDSYTLRPKTGLHIQGRLLIDGNPPGKSLTFSASVFQSGLTDRFYHALGREAYNSDLEPIPVQCDPDGEFSIEGLQVGWMIRINLPSGLRMMEGDPDQGRRVRYIDLLREDVALELLTRRETHVRGRCVDRDGTPLRDVPVQVKVAWNSLRHRNTAPTNYQLLRTDGRGQFTIWLDPSSFYKVQFIATWGGLEILKEFDTSERGERSLSDFIFPRARDLRLQVVDEDGNPVGGTKVGSPDGRFLLTADTRGNLVLPLIPTQTLDLHVAAPGFAFQTVAIPQLSSASVQVIKLQRTTHLLIALKDHRGRPAPSREVNLRFAGMPLRQQEAFESSIYRSAYPELRFTRRRDAFGILGKTNDRGEMHIYDIAPGSEILARVFGRGGPLINTRYVVKGLSEERVDLVLPEDAAASISGQVMDVDGHPISDALILMGESEDRLVQVGFSDDEGRFLTRDVVFQPLHVRVAKVGYRSDARFVATPRERRKTLRFLLRPSTRCRILVKDGKGNLLQKSHVEVPRVFFAGMGPVCMKRGDGVFDIIDLGDDPCPAFVYGPGGERRKVIIRPDIDTLKTVRFD